MPRQDLNHCAFYKERGPNTQQYGNKFLFECAKCLKSRSEDESNVRKFLKANRMDAFLNGHPAAHLPKLSIIKELLISPIHATFSCSTAASPMVSMPTMAM
jgi:hypothetical protein